MAKCFCGCGRDIRFGRRWLSNKGAAGLHDQLAVIRRAAERGARPDGAGDLHELVTRADRVFAQWREYIHGTRPRRDLDRPAMKALVDDIMEARKQLALEAEFVGWNMLGASEIWESGVHAPATIADIRDTGTTVNQQPRVEIVLRVEPDGEEPFELRRTLIVSRVKLPRVGERVEVAYDPDDREETFTFRVPDLTDGAAGRAAGDDRLDRIARLHELHRSGALTAEEFAREKARLLDAGA